MARAGEHGDRVLYTSPSRAESIDGGNGGVTG